MNVTATTAAANNIALTFWLRRHTRTQLAILDRGNGTTDDLKVWFPDIDSVVTGASLPAIVAAARKNGSTVTAYSDVQDMIPMGLAF